MLLPTQKLELRLKQLEADIERIQAKAMVPNIIPSLHRLLHYPSQSFLHRDLVDLTRLGGSESLEILKEAGPFYPMSVPFSVLLKQLRAWNVDQDMPESLTLQLYVSRPIM